MAQMKYFYELTISSSPHVHSPVTTQTIMRDVLIALTPALVGSVFFFGFRALLVTLISAAACVFFEWLYCRLMKLDCKVYDLSAVVTSVLLSFVCPPTIPYWMIIVGDAFAIILVKMLFGGIGRTSSTPPWPAVPSCSAGPWPCPPGSRWASGMPPASSPPLTPSPPQRPWLPCIRA